MSLDARLTETWLLLDQRKHSICEGAAPMRRIAAFTTNPIAIAMVAMLAISGCASKKAPNSAADLGLNAGNNAAPGSSQDFTLNVGDRIFFDTDSSQIRADAQTTLSKQAQWLNQYGNYKITIEGHADERGGKAATVAALGAHRHRLRLVVLGVAGQHDRCAVIVGGLLQQPVARFTGGGGEAGRRLVALPAQCDVADRSGSAEICDRARLSGGFGPQRVVDGDRDQPRSRHIPPRQCEQCHRVAAAGDRDDDSWR
jgi:peptidoglycan-associated lipoprotein